MSISFLLSFNVIEAQTIDTLYILIKKDNEKINRIVHKTWLGIDDSDNNNKNETFFYAVHKTISKNRDFELFHFVFYNQKSSLYIGDKHPPLKFCKNKRFLKKIKEKTIDISEIKELEVSEVHEKYRNKNYVFFIIDEIDFKGKKIIVREVEIGFP